MNKYIFTPQYPILDANKLPEDVWIDEELFSNELRIINPKYNSTFHDWLVENNFEVKPYYILLDR
jgi:hypothetical protein